MRPHHPPPPGPPPPVPDLLDRLVTVGVLQHLLTAGLTIHVHVHDDPLTRTTLVSLAQEILMAANEMKAALAKINAATDNIAADLKGLKEAIKPGMTDAEVAEVQGLLDAAAGKLEGIAAETPDA